MTVYLFGVPLVNVQLIALRLAVSMGSPTSFPSTKTKLWHPASTYSTCSGNSLGDVVDLESLFIIIGSILYYFSPATPFRIKLSLVKVPVLSKQHTSTFPANGMRKGSVQNIP